MTQVFKGAVGFQLQASILSSVGGWLHFLTELQFKNKKAGVYGCYGWSGEVNAVLREELKKAGFAVVDAEVKVNWNPTEQDLSGMQELAKALLA